MTALVWDQTVDRSYQSGVSRGVLYLPTGGGVVWNGLTRVVQNEDSSVDSVYWDGMKIHDLVNTQDYTADVSAFTYPEELDGDEVFGLSNQPVKTFGFSYRTEVDDSAYKIHIIFNAKFLMEDVEYETMGNTTEPIEFGWSVHAPRVEVEGFAPIADITIDSRHVDSLLLEELEGLLYGTETTDSELLPIDQFLVYLREWARIVIVDNGDGTWSATTVFSGYIFDLGGDEFRIDHGNVTYLNANTYEISNTSHDTET